MTMVAEITWRTRESVASLVEMDKVHDDIATQISQELPQGIHVTRLNGDCLTIVLGATDGSILNFVSANQEPPYFVSLGAPTAKGIFTFFVSLDRHSEALASSVISESMARQVLREFVVLQTGLPDTIRWDEV